MSSHTNWGQNLYWWIMNVKWNHILAEYTKDHIAFSEPLFKIRWHTNFLWKWIRVALVGFGLLLSFNGFTYCLKTEGQHNGISNYRCHSMDSLTIWRHKGRIFGLVNYHCHIMDSLTPWRHRGRIFGLVNYHWHLMDSLTHWRHKDRIFGSANYHWHLMHSLTIWRHKGRIFGSVN